MKRFFIGFGLISFLTVALFAQDFSALLKTQGTAPKNSQMSELQAAYKLAEYGYENDSATALITAAQMLSKIPTQPLGVQPTVYGEAPKNASSPSALDPKRLLSDALRIARNDQTLKRLAEEVDKEMKKNGTTRGAIGGPKSACNVAAKNGGYVVYEVPFKGGEWAEIYMFSLDEIDLDLYVFEGNEVIAKDDRYATDAYAAFFPTKDTVVKIVVKNDSKKDSGFMLFTN